MVDDIKKNIQDGLLTSTEGDKLLQLWIKYSIKNLPKAQYRNEVKRRFIFEK